LKKGKGILLTIGISFVCTMLSRPLDFLYLKLRDTFAYVFQHHFTVTYFTIISFTIIVLILRMGFKLEKNIKKWLPVVTSDRKSSIKTIQPYFITSLTRGPPWQEKNHLFQTPMHLEQVI